MMSKMQTTVRHLAWLFLIALANSSLFTLHSSLLFSCSSSDDEESEEMTQEEMLTVEASASATAYVDAKAEADGARRYTGYGHTTRSWDPPTPYLLYDDLYESYRVDGTEIFYASLSESTIDVFFTQGNPPFKDEINPLKARLKYVTSDASPFKWKLVLPKDIDPMTVPEGYYYIYGFVPSDAADDVSIDSILPPDGSGDYAEGAVMTIRGLQSITSDACVIIGAREGFSPDYDGEYTDTDGDGEYDSTEPRTNLLKPGDFKFKLTNRAKADDPAPTNYLFLLFDHLYSALNVGMKVDPIYNELRHIKLKELRLQAQTAEGIPTKNKTDITITLHHTADGSMPFTNSDITYSPVADSGDSDGQAFRSATGELLLSTTKWFVCDFMPENVAMLVLTSTYDVYDTKGNLIRKDSKATNTLLLRNIIGGFTTPERGRIYNVEMTIKPTYLYQLSDPDLDNPTVVLEQKS